jgi:hypothetical protein
VKHIEHFTPQTRARLELHPFRIARNVNPSSWAPASSWPPGDPQALPAPISSSAEPHLPTARAPSGHGRVRITTQPDGCPKPHQHDCNRQPSSLVLFASGAGIIAHFLELCVTLKAQGIGFSHSRSGRRSWSGKGETKRRAAWCRFGAELPDDLRHSRVQMTANGPDPNATLQGRSSGFGRAIAQPLPHSSPCVRDSRRPDRGRSCQARNIGIRGGRSKARSHLSRATSRTTP